MDLVKFFLSYSRKTVVVSLLAGVFSGGCNAALLALINTLLKKNGNVSLLLVLAFAGLCIMLPLSRLVAEVLLNSLGQDSLYSLRMQISRQVLAAPLRHLEELGSHRVLAVLTDDLPIITNTVQMLPLICLNATVLMGCLVYIGLLSPKLLAIIMGFLVLGIVGYQLPILKAQRIFRDARADGDALLKHFQAMLQGSKELKLHDQRRKAFLSGSLDTTASSFRSHNKKAMKIYTVSATWGQTLVFIVVGLVLLVPPASRNLTGAALTGCTLALLYLMTPLQVIMNTAPTVARANVAVRNVKDLGFQLSSQEEDKLLDSSAAMSAQDWHSLQFQSVTHSYRREGELETFMLGPMDVTFQRGELVFITGGNGSGKTTFVKLLTGLYAPEQGFIAVDGQQQQREEYRRYFSAVFADCFLFDRLLGVSDADMLRNADSYLRQLKLAHKVKIEDGKFSTIDLSQGQRKRLALLTAYLEDRMVYVFDEWAADQDPYFKEVFYLQILPELKAKGKTVFVISHDDRYYHVADRIVKFEEGRIASDLKKELAPGSLAMATHSIAG